MHLPAVRPPEHPHHRFHGPRRLGVGVTVFSNDLAALKEIVYEMRFDEVSTRFGEFGPFYVGLVMDPPDVFERAGIPA